MNEVSLRLKMFSTVKKQDSGQGATTTSSPGASPQGLSTSQAHQQQQQLGRGALTATVPSNQASQQMDFSIQVENAQGNNGGAEPEKTVQDTTGMEMNCI